MSFLKLFPLVLFFFLSALPVTAQTYEAGSDAAGLLKDGNWYLGTIDQINSPDEYVFTTREGRQAYLKKSHLRELGKSSLIKPGDIVAAVRGSELFFTGKVQSVSSSGALIAWIDWKTPATVPFNRIITGLGNYTVKKAEEPKDDRLGFTLGDTLIEISRTNGKVYLKGEYIGDYDFRDGNLTTFSSFKNWHAQVSADGSIYSYKEKTITGKVYKNGNFYSGSGTTGSIGKDGTIYRSSNSVGKAAKPNLSWAEIRAIVAALAVLTPAFGF